MNYKITLNTGEVFRMNGAEFNAQEVTNALNTGAIRFINLGGAIVAASNLANKLPVEVAQEDHIDVGKGE